MKKLESILLVDDDQVCNYINEDIIRVLNAGIKVDTALNGEIALDFLNEHSNNSPQLILLDLNMPVMDGFEFLDEFKKLPEKIRERIAIVILTSSDYEKDIERARQYHVVSAYITKPLTPEKMVSIMEECFRSNGDGKVMKKEF